ncbi:MAG: glycosyltransferase [Acidobacteria bacterium]|nr:glycosyltransferase [Acidobacteriota bacterium]MBI3422575.1 glycosyltransferase [Acidobacteriota bacterium]
MKLFSIVVIGKNEEAHLGDCLRSVLVAAEEIGNAEIVYVDSASTDHSVEIAQALGVRVLALRPEWQHTPAAGRYIGFHHTSGELLMFVDGDCIIERQWLSRALAFFAEPSVAGVAGYLNDLDAQGREIPFVGERAAVVKPLTTLRGIAAYRRTALEEVGPFNPHLRSEEEAELALRLRGANWQLLHLPFPMGSHRRGHSQLRGMWRNLRLGRVSGVGLTWRYACQYGCGWQFCREQQRATVLFGLLTLLLSPGLALLALGQTTYAWPFLALLALWMLAVTLKKRSLAGPVEYVGIHVLIGLGLLSGLFVHQLAAPAAYPRDVIEPGLDRASNTETLAAPPVQNAAQPELQIAYSRPVVLPN